MPGFYYVDSFSHICAFRDENNDEHIICGKRGESGFLDGPSDVSRLHSPSACFLSIDGSLLYIIDKGNKTLRCWDLKSQTLCTLSTVSPSPNPGAKSSPDAVQEVSDNSHWSGCGEGIVIDSVQAHHTRDGHAAAFTSHRVISGVHCWDFEVLQNCGGMCIGLAECDIDLTASWCDASMRGKVQYLTSYGSVRDGDLVLSAAAAEAEISTGDCIGMRADLDQGTLIFTRNGQQVASARAPQPPAPQLRGCRRSTPLCAALCLRSLGDAAALIRSAAHGLPSPRTPARGAAAPEPLSHARAEATFWAAEVRAHARQRRDAQAAELLRAPAAAARRKGLDATRAELEHGRRSRGDGLAAAEAERLLDDPDLGVRMRACHVLGLAAPAGCARAAAALRSVAESAAEPTALRVAARRGLEALPSCE